MPDPKKIMVKVPKKSTAEKEEAKKGIDDNETSSENRLELTKKYVDAKENMQTNANTEKGKSFTEKTQGIIIDNDNLSSKPKLFKRKVIASGGENGTTKILSDDGKSVKYEGRSYMQSTKDALRQNDSQTKDTNARRENNSNYYNVNSGAKKELDKKDKETLLRNSKAIITKK